jgi:hypothetical protein
MISLADVLEALHRSHDSFATVRAEGASDGAPWRLWWAGPWLVRVDWHNQRGAYSAGVDGGDWWLRTPNGRTRTNRRQPEKGLSLGPWAEILHSRALLGDTLLHFVAEASIADRRAAILTAAPVPEAKGQRWWGYGDPFEVAIDLETGIALRTPMNEVTLISYDETFDEAMFGLPPRGRRRPPS